MKHWMVILLVIFVVAVIGGAGYMGTRSVQPESTPVPQAPLTVPVTRGNVQQTVTAPGKLVTTHQVDLALEVSGRLAEVLVRPGDSVEAGDVLARLETGPLEQAVGQTDVDLRLAQLKLAEARKGSSEAELAEAEAAVRDAQVKLNIVYQRYEARQNSDVDHRVRAAKVTYDWYVGNYQRRKAGFEDGNVSQTDHDYAMNEMLKAEGRLNDAQAESKIEDITYANQVDQARNTLYQAQERLEVLQSGPLTETLMRAELEVDKALLVREQARADLEGAILRAPFDGVVTEVDAAPGDQVTSGAKLVTLLDPSAVEGKVTVIEEDFPLVQPDQPVEMFFDALPSATLMMGQVARIVPQRLPGDLPLYPVYVAMADELPEGLAPGMTVDTSIVIASRSDVLQLPRALVRARFDDTAEIKVWANGRAETRTVQVGLRGDVYVEILDGLREGEQVEVGEQ